MGKVTTLKFFFLLLFTVNQAFAAGFYFENVNTKSNEQVIIGDLGFSYSFSRTGKISKEIFEKDSLRVYIERGREKSSSMVLEKKTRLGILYLNYKSNGESWKNTGISFRKYTTFYKDSADDQCTANTSSKNQKDLLLISQGTSKENFANLFFEKSCAENLSREEFNDLVDGTYKVLNSSNDELGLMKTPQIITCVQPGGKTGQLYWPFQTLRNQVALTLKGSTKSIDEVRANKLTPFPISCDFKGKDSQKCGASEEGLKNKISLNTSCIKKDSKKIQEKVQETIIHEFAHTVREPKMFSESDVKNFENGNCNPKEGSLVDVGFTDAGVTSVSYKEADGSKNTAVAEANAPKTGAKTLPADVANPYSSFTERATTPTQTTTVASNDTSSSATEVGDGNTFSGSSSRSVQQRSIASTSSVNTTSNSSYSVNTSVPTLQQQAQYQNVKTYVDASVNTVAKKIAPIVNYVESPAFAATLPPTSFKNSNTGDSVATMDTSASVPSAAVAKAAATTRNAEVAKSTAASTSTGSREIASSSAPANLGSSTSATGSTNRKPAAVNKNANRLSSADSNLDNAYALKVRKKLLSDSSYRNELRSQGVQIEFADGYKFETPGHKVLYTEKNGVLVGGK